MASFCLNATDFNYEKKHIFQIRHAEPPGTVYNKKTQLCPKARFRFLCANHADFYCHDI